MIAAICLPRLPINLFARVSFDGSVTPSPTAGGYWFAERPTSSSAARSLFGDWVEVVGDATHLCNDSEAGCSRHVELLSMCCCCYFPRSLV